MSKRLLLVLVGVIGGMLFMTSSVKALPSVGSSLSVSPALEQLNVTAGQTDVTFLSKITNNSKVTVTLALFTSDFSALNNSGGVTFFNNASKNPFGLASHIMPAQSVVTLTPGVSQSIPVTIANTDQLSPGGHYGALIYRVVPVGSSLKGNQLYTNQEISVLVFLTTSGNGIEAIHLEKPNLSPWTSSFPTFINVAFTNTGNVQVVPQGVITVDYNSREYARGIINTDSGMVLPGTTRLYQVPIRIGQTPPIGNYQVAVAYQASANASLITYSTSFFFFDKALILMIVVVILGVILLILYWKGLLIRQIRTRSRAPESKKKRNSRRISVTFDE